MSTKIPQFDPRVFVLMDEIENHKGGEVLELTNCLTNAEYILEKNFEEFQNAIQTFNDNSILLKENRGKLDETVREFLRRFHNYESSLFSLEEQMEAFVGHLDKERPDLRKKFDKLPKPSSATPESRILGCLRIYLQHYRVPSVVVAWHIGEPISLKLNKEKLLKWRGWRDCKDDLAKQDSSIDVKRLMRVCQQETEGICKEFHSLVASLYSAEIAEYLEKSKEFSRLLANPKLT